MRSRQTRWGRRTLAPLMLAWINVVLQPCAMAMADAAACPDCPASHGHEPMTLAAMAEHDHAMAVTADDGSHSVGSHSAGDHSAAHEHGIASDCATCGGVLADCINLDDIKQNEREKQSIPEPALAWLLPPPVDCVPSSDHGPPPSFRPGDAARLAGAFPPLNVLYCVYLD